MKNCKYCGNEIFRDEGYETIGRCKNKNCYNFNIAVDMR